MLFVYPTWQQKEKMQLNMERLLKCFVLLFCITMFATCVKESVIQDDTKDISKERHKPSFDVEDTVTYESCIDCMADDIVKRTIVLGSKDSSITIYPIITPSNHNLCDSMAYNPKWGAWVPPYLIHPDLLCSCQEAIDSINAGNDTACPCIKNPDTVFNDPKNSFFFIGGLQKFPNNSLTIYWNEQDSLYGRYDNPKITKKKRVYNNYDNKNNLFIGEGYSGKVYHGGDYDFYDTKPLPSGIYDYSLVLYKDEKHTIQIGETIEGKFAIIRTNRILTKDCKNQARDADDPLLN